jgi:hypothetical protein
MLRQYALVDHFTNSQDDRCAHERNSDVHFERLRTSRKSHDIALWMGLANICFWINKAIITTRFVQEPFIYSPRNIGMKLVLWW